MSTHGDSEQVSESWDDLQKEKEKACSNTTASAQSGTAAGAPPAIPQQAPPAHESDFDRRRRERAAQEVITQPEDWRAETRRYLQNFDTTVSKDEDLVRWWFVSNSLLVYVSCISIDQIFQLHRHEYPTLARLAIDILSIPASSVACERLFSAAKEIATHKRSRLGSERFEQLQMMKFAWRGTIFDYAKLRSQEVEEVEILVHEFEEFEIISSSYL